VNNHRIPFDFITQDERTKNLNGDSSWDFLQKIEAMALKKKKKTENEKKGTIPSNRKK